MKKLLACAVVLCLLITTVACGSTTEGNTTLLSSEAVTSTETVVETTQKKEKTNEKKGESTTEAPNPKPMDNSAKPLKASFGKNTGTDKTYTGLEPLPERELPVIDPQNVRGLSGDEIKHSFGVSKDGIPHEISVNNQKIYEQYGAMCLDTSGEKCIYLTFDCGYENGCTEKILDTLRDKKVSAAFFVTMDHVKSSPRIVARMINEGHTVGNHSVTHPNFSKITRTQMAEELQGLDNHLRQKFGYSSPFFRFPEGACSLSALDLVQNCGYKSVFWSSAYADWDVNNTKGSQYAFDTVTERLHPGCVLLLHAVSPDNADALGDIIDYAHSQGYIFKSL